jgi:hypothetical protein
MFRGRGEKNPEGGNAAVDDDNDAAKLFLPRGVQLPLNPIIGRSDPSRTGLSTLGKMRGGTGIDRVLYSRYTGTGAERDAEEKMMDGKDASGEGEPLSARDKENSKWLLITQFYEDSVLRYGPESAQARALSMLRGDDSE